MLLLIVTWVGWKFLQACGVSNWGVLGMTNCPVDSIDDRADKVTDSPSLPGLFTYSSARYLSLTERYALTSQCSAIPETIKEEDRLDNLFETCDISALSGDWVSVSRLTTRDANEPLEFRYNFNQSGVGIFNVDFSEENYSCSSMARASFDEACALSIELDKLACESEGNGIETFSLKCIVEADKVQCEGEQTSGNIFRVGFSAN